MRKLDRAPQTLGEKLRALRRGQAVTLDMLVARTQIQKKYLHALERGDYDTLPDPIYTRQFVRMYATVLGADTKYFLELYEEESGRCDLITPLQTPRRRLQRHILRSWNQTLGYGAIAAVLGVFFLYIMSQIVGVFTAPSLTIVSPLAQQSMTTQPTIMIEGSVESGSTVLINNDTVPTDENNTFRSEVPLQKGVNVIDIEAVRRYSARAKTTRTIIYDDSEPQTGNPSTAPTDSP